jgi:hypothetical protein
VFISESQKRVRSDIKMRVYERKGHAHSNVTLKTHYLVVCNEENNSSLGTGGDFVKRFSEIDARRLATPSRRS